MRILGWLGSLTGDRTLAFERPAWLLLPLVVAPLLFDSAFKLACGVLGCLVVSLLAWLLAQAGEHAGTPARPG